MKKSKGITLVALVVTIVVLILLAGISINFAIGNNGISTKAKQAKEMQEMSDVHDKLELIRGKVAVDNETIVTWDKYKDELIKENIITGDDDVEDIEDGKKQIVTDTGYVAVIEITSDGTVGKIEIIGKEDSLKVNITNVAVTSETSSIKVDVAAKRTDNATFKYYYKIEGGEYQTSPVHEGTDLSYTITNLAQNTTYTIKVEATNKNGTVEKEAVARTGEVAPAEGAITFDNLTWISGKASIIVNKTTSDDLQIQYKVNTGSYAIITSGATVSNMSLGDVLTVRLYDGTNYGSSASLTVADTTVPNSATISLSSTSVTAGTSLTATVTQTDSQSGVNITSCKWVFNTTSSNIGTTESSYTDGTFSTTPQTITLQNSTIGTYYLHVLTIDNAGNKIETISSAVNSTFVLPTYTGGYEIAGDASKGYMTLKTSGTLTLCNGTYDVCLVAGGTSGGNASGCNMAGHSGAGGNGGEVLNKIAISLAGNYAITIGNGGKASDAFISGEQSTFDTLYTARPNQGSAGGSCITNYAGSFDGFNNGNPGQDGKYAFGDSTFKKYGAGGGSGDFTCTNYTTQFFYGGTGGNYGGGTGGRAYNERNIYNNLENYNTPGENGAANTGSGGGGSGALSYAGDWAYYSNQGAGGSGVCLIRWGY